MATCCDLFIFAGEPSADAHGSQLLQALHDLHPDLKVTGIAGPKMRLQKIDCLIPMESFQVMGFSDVIKALPRLWRYFKTILKNILSLNPKIVVLIDYPGFNLRLEKALRKKGYSGKLVHYISPSVWAWKKKRADEMAKHLDLLLTIFPFEASYFSHTSLKVTYVGNPSLEALSKEKPVALSCKIAGERALLGIFPGSRPSEIKHHLSTQLVAALALLKEHPLLAIVISVANPSVEPLIKEELNKLKLAHLLGQTLYLIPGKETSALMQASRLAIAKSGTVTLELALHGVPTVVVYALTWFNAFLARSIFRIRLPHYCIVNILCESRVFPELIYKAFTAENVYTVAKHLYLGPSRDFCLRGCKRLPHILDNHEAPSSPLKQASFKAAKTILELLD